MIRDLRDGIKPFDGLVDAETKAELDKAFNKGIECILKTQIRVNGKPTVWCQQHDRETFAPAAARSYELPSYCSSESASLVRLLMELPNPDQRIIDAVNGAMEWFEKHKIILGFFSDSNSRPNQSLRQKHPPVAIVVGTLHVFLCRQLVKQLLDGGCADASHFAHVG